MKTMVLTLILAFQLGLMTAQQYHGLEKSELMAKMKHEHPEFLWQDQVQNQKFNYLKFVDALDRRTWLFFLDENDRCNFIRLMYDYTYLKKTEEWLNNQFRKTGEDQWMVRQGSRILIVQLTRGEWYFTVTLQESNE